MSITVWRKKGRYFEREDKLNRMEDANARLWLVQPLDNVDYVVQPLDK